MNSEKAAQLKIHLDAIAQLLYEESDPATMQTLEGIEMTVRQQIQTHVSPELGHFLFAQRLAQQQAETDVNS